MWRPMSVTRPEGAWRHGEHLTSKKKCLIYSKGALGAVIVLLWKHPAPLNS